MLTTFVDGDLRLVSSTGDPSKGRLEVYYRGRWGTVCSRNPNTLFSRDEALVACRQLGYVQGSRFGRATDLG